jgi:hypothetical protein
VAPQIVFSFAGLVASLESCSGSYECTLTVLHRTRLTAAVNYILKLALWTYIPGVTSLILVRARLLCFLDGIVSSAVADSDLECLWRTEIPRCGSGWRGRGGVADDRIAALPS